MPAGVGLSTFGATLSLWVDGDYLTPHNLNTKGVGGAGGSENTSNYHPFVQSAITNLTWASVVTPDASYQINKLNITSTAPFAFGTPTNRQTIGGSGASFAGGTELLLDITNLSGASSGTITMGSVYLTGGGSALSVLTYGNRRIISFYDDGVNFVELYHSAADIADIPIQVPAFSVTITPSSATLAASSSETTLLTATVRDAFNNILTGRTITWSSSDNLMATVTPGPSPTAVVTAVGNFGGPDWPNEPAGYSSLPHSYGFSDTIAVEDATQLGSTVWFAMNGNGLVSRATITSAPKSPPHVIEWKYPEDFEGGSAPATVYTTAPAGNQRDLFAGYIFKYGTPYVNHSQGTKQWYPHTLITGGPQEQTFFFRFWNGKMHAQVVDTPDSYNLISNVNNPNIDLNTWYRMEVEFHPSSGSDVPDMVLKWWLSRWNGTSWDAPVLCGDWGAAEWAVLNTQLGFTHCGTWHIDTYWSDLQFSPTYGGSPGEFVPADQYWWVDEFYASVPSLWPNEPIGMTLLADYPFTDTIPVGTDEDQVLSNGWKVVQSNGGTLVSTESNLTAAPVSSPYVARFRYPAGFAGGNGPGNIFYNIPGGYGEIYQGYVWTPSNPWENHAGSNVNKLNFLWSDGTNLIYFNMKGPAPYQLEVELVFPTISNGHLVPSSGDDPGARILEGVGAHTITLGQPHLVEYYTKKSTTPTSQDGIMRWWISAWNGTGWNAPILVGDYTNINTPNNSWIQASFPCTWGGTGDTKAGPADEFHRFDHTRITAR